MSISFTDINQGVASSVADAKDRIATDYLESISRRGGADAKVAQSVEVVVESLWSSPNVGAT